FGGKFWSPLAICIVGGVGGATFIALFFVPCTYLLLVNYHGYFVKNLIFPSSKRDILKLQKSR
ncbi:MAG: hypothetical protein AAFR89_10000, partial [Cyanobacteria bacterium J06633_1]